MASRAQKWIDQAISRNIYLESRDISEMARLYAAAWEKGVKTTYYLHVKPRHTAEQSTVRVNKAETLPAGRGGTPVRPAESATSSAPRRGFGFGKAAGTTASPDVSASSGHDASSGVSSRPQPAAPAVTAPAVTAPTATSGFSSLTSHAAPPSVLAAVVDAARQALPATRPTPAPAPAPVQGSTSPAHASAPVAPRAGFGFGRVAPAEHGPEAPADLTPPASATVLDVQEAEIIDGVACPVDPMERLQCESCQ